MTTLQFLLLEDNLLDAEVIQMTLAGGGIDHELLRVETRPDFTAALETETIDLILADYSLPSFDGLSALGIATNLTPDIPFIFVSGSLGEELAIEALKYGATDYVLKQRLGRLVPSVRRALREAQERRALKQAEAEREQLLEREKAARAEAERANRTKDEFLAVLSHELRTPLNPILGWAKLLRNQDLDAVQTDQALATIEQNAKLQCDLIDNLLDISRIIQGRLNLKVSPLNFAAVVRAAIKTLQLAAEAKSIQVESILNDSIGQISGDPTRLQQIVWNLLANAIKFTPAQGRVEVSLECVEDQAQLTICDTGIGIAPTFLPNVFDYFCQADSSTTRRYGGLGLGLAIVRHLVELHGGTVTAASPGEGLGTIFIVKLPLISTQTETELDSILDTDPFLQLNGIQVLVVDDEPDSLALAKFVLQQAGARVMTAATAREGLQAFIQSLPDVLVSDIGMLEMDGYMLLQQIRALPPEQGGQVKAVALTAYAGEVNRQKVLQAGFQQHISKPMDPQELVTAVSTVLTL
jgi:signal transduction histidine kinase